MMENDNTTNTDVKPNLEENSNSQTLRRSNSQAPSNNRYAKSIRRSASFRNNFVTSKLLEKRLFWKTSTSESIEEDECFSDENETFCKRPDDFYRNTDYRIYFIAKLILDLIKDDAIKNFKLSSSDINFDAFNDVILETEFLNGDKQKFAIQLRYCSEEKLTLSSLQQKTGSFSISNYLSIFRENKNVLSGCILILMTNLKLDVAKRTQIELKNDQVIKCEINEVASKSGKRLFYKLQPMKESSEDFFKNFRLYTNKQSIAEVKKDLIAKLQELFDCDKTVLVAYMNFITLWCNRENAKEKLDKTIMQEVLAACLVPSIHSISFGTVNQKAKILQKAIAKFDITVFNRNSTEKVEQLWGDVKDKLNSVSFDKINKILQKYEPNCEDIRDLDQLNSKDCTKLLWLMNKCPLMVFPNQLTYEVIGLCRHKKYVLIGDDDASKSFEEYKVFRKLSDLENHTTIFENLTTTFMCELSGNKISLDQVIGENEEFSEIITTNELLEMVHEPYLLTKLIHSAARHGFYKITELLLRSGADVNAKDSNGNTALHLATKHEYNEIIKLLTAEEGNSSLDLARKYDVNFDKKGPLHSALRDGNYKFAQQLIAEIVNMNKPKRPSTTPSHLDNLQLEITAFSIQYEKDVTEGKSFAPLHIASNLDLCEIAEMLIQSNVDIDETDNDDNSPLHFASEKGFYKMVALLIKHGCQVNVSNGAGYTPLHVASSNGCYEIVASLIKSGAKVDFCDNDGYTPLHLASLKGHAKVVKLLIHSGAAVDCVNKQGAMALHLASKKGYCDIVGLLFKSGVSADCGDYNGFTPLHLAVDQDQCETVGLLIKLGANIEAKTKSGVKPIEMAVKKNNEKIIKLLFNARTSKFSTSIL